jgi:transcriptional regulator with PAS, ATPase and Fis domain
MSRPPTLEQLEKQHILAALARNLGNRTATAAELGISERTLYYRLAQYQQRRTIAP